MSFAAIQMSIDGTDTPIYCPSGWTVGELATRIRDRYGLRGGGVNCHGLPTRATDVISEGHVYTFTDFHKVRRLDENGKFHLLVLIKTIRLSTHVPFLSC